MDEEALVSFIEWLPVLKANETFLVCLFARKKYAPDAVHLKSDKCQLGRFTSDKKHLINNIRKMEVAYGAYEQEGIPIPQEALALYISTNPRNLELATKNALKELIDLITKPYNGFNPHQVVLSEIQKASGTKHYMDIDFDHVPLDSIKKAIEGNINRDAVTFLQTRGGFHALVGLKRIEKAYAPTWYQKLTSIEGCDQSGDGGLMPVPGCCQGGFIPKFVE